MKQFLVPLTVAVVAVAPVTVATAPASASSDGSRPFITSAVEHPNGTVTLLLHRGVSRGWR